MFFTTIKTFPHIFETKNVFSNNDNKSQQIFKTAHKSIFSKLCNYASNLNTGNFEGVNGNATIALVGPRGIGKSSTFVKFTKLCNILYPNVIPICISYLWLENVPCMCTNSGMEIVRDALAKH